MKSSHSEKAQNNPQDKRPLRKPPIASLPLLYQKELTSSVNLSTEGNSVEKGDKNCQHQETFDLQSKKISDNSIFFDITGQSPERELTSSQTGNSVSKAKKIETDKFIKVTLPPDKALKRFQDDTLKAKLPKEKGDLIGSEIPKGKESSAGDNSLDVLSPMKISKEKESSPMKVEKESSPMKVEKESSPMKVGKEKFPLTNKDISGRIVSNKLAGGGSRSSSVDRKLRPDNLLHRTEEGKGVGLTPSEQSESGKHQFRAFRNYVRDLPSAKSGFNPRRGGVIVYTGSGSQRLFGLGIDSRSHDLTDFGGGISIKDRDSVAGALREFREESLGIFGPIDPLQVKNSLAIYSDHIIIIFLGLPRVDTDSVSIKFAKKVYDIELAEVSSIIWLTEVQFRSAINLGHPKIYRRVRTLLSQAGEIFDALPSLE